MTKKWQAKLAKGITHTDTKYPYKEPFICRPANDDLTKQWSVDYSIWSEREQTLKRKRVILVGATVTARLSDGKAVIAELKKKLKAGACVDPLQKVPARVDTPDKVLPTTSLKKAIEIYLDFKKRTTGHNSWRTYRSSLRVLLQYLSDTPGLKKVSLATFHHGDALDFLDQTITKYLMSNRGRNNTKDNAKMLYGHWCKRINATAGRVLLVNPFDDIADLSVTSGKHTAFTDAQRLDFRKCATEQQEGQLLLFVQFMYYTFMRPRQELRLLRVRDLREGTIFVDKTNSKNNDDGYVEIPPPLVSLINEYKLREYAPHCYLFGREGVPGPDPVGPDYFYHHHRRILEKMGVPGDAGYDMYSWKHTGVIALWSATQNIKLIQQQCRHSTAAQTETYLRDLGIIVRHTQIQDFPEF